MIRPARAAAALSLAAAGATLAVLPAAPAVAAQQAFTVTGEHQFVVPAGVTKVHVVAVGAKGGAGSDQDTTPVTGFGGVARADVAVSPGQVLYVEVGGQGADGAAGGAGGANGGGNGGSGGGPGVGGGGGGASDVRKLPVVDGSSLASRLVVAGGGGGGGEGLGPPDVVGGAGGNAGAAGGDGSGLANPTFAGHGGQPGTTSAGGAAGGAGACSGIKPAGVDGGAGSVGAGGAGGTTVASTGSFECDMAGGGGGGGLYGGGGGGSGSSGGPDHTSRGGGGGGGGSSGFGAGTTNRTTAVDTTGSPRVAISWTPPTYRPDGQVKRSSDASYVGNNVYNTTGTNQTRTWTTTRGHDRAFVFRVQNDGNVPDTYRIKGCSSSTGFVVTWTHGSTKVTSAVTGGTYKTARLSPGGTSTVTLHIHVRTGALIGAVKSCLTRTTSITKSTVVDGPRAKLTVVKG